MSARRICSRAAVVLSTGPLRKLLHDAVWRNDVRAAADILKVAPELVNVRDRRGRTLLAVAQWGSCLRMLRLLLKHGADPNARDRKGRTPLHTALTFSATLAEVDLVLNAGADVEARDADGNTPLLSAACFFPIGVVRALLAKKPDVNAANVSGNSALMLAARRANGVATLLVQHGANVNQRSRYGDMALHAAAAFGIYRNVVMLVEHGADVDATDTSGATPVVVARQHNHKRTIAYLRSQRAR